MLVLLENGDFALSITRLEFDPETETLSPIIEFLGVEFALGMLVVGFLTLSGIAHTLLATALYGRYRRYLRMSKNPYRWYEYSLSASLMLVAIAVISGISDLGTLLAIFVLTALMNLFGLLMERYNDLSGGSPRRVLDWKPFIFGCLAGVVPWIIIAITIVATYVEYPGEFPNFVIGATVVTFVFFNSFAVNMYLQYRKLGRWRDYLFGERVYILLSLFAKTVLAWWVYFGIQGSPIVTG